MKPGGQGEQAQGVGDGGAGFSKPPGRFFLRQAGRVHQLTDGGGLLHGVEILTLQVLDKGGQHAIFV
ncbi:hypothetical protein SDC9_125840 [bioreactor metagenome]|uniref:Uncharacterized protein n=1 Tax=bioreactor metagenome TaxID=1076179 RepID=A0A645CPK0_9ZZZZ